MTKPSTPAVWASGKTFGFQPSPAQQAQGFDYIATVRPGTGAPITDDHDWPLNNVTSALKWVMDQLPEGGLKYGCPLVGSLIPWPLQAMPHEIWPDCGMVFIPYIAQAFDGVRYPLLKQLHPSGVLPADMRGEFPRGWDNGRGVDSGRSLMSSQSASIVCSGDPTKSGISVNGFVNSADDDTARYKTSLGSDGTPPLVSGVSFGSSTATNTYADMTAVAMYVRSRNIAWNMIVRAA